MTVETYPFNTVQFLTDPADQVELMRDALESGSSEAVASAIAVIARARGMTEFADETGVAHGALPKALSPAVGDPRLSTVMKVTKALGLELFARPAMKRRIPAGKA